VIIIDVADLCGEGQTRDRGNGESQTAKDLVGEPAILVIRGDTDCRVAHADVIEGPDMIANTQAKIGYDGSGIDADQPEIQIINEICHEGIGLRLAAAIGSLTIQIG
jgi:hypothetical protein